MMNIVKSKQYSAIRKTVGPLFLTAFLGQTMAVELGLTDAPLFLKSGVQPNIYFVVDDSGSMAWDYLRSQGGGASHFKSVGNSTALRPSFNSRAQMLNSCSGFNVLAYDPNQIYTPWDGVNKYGNAYQDQSVTSALSDPYENSGAKNLEKISSSKPAGYFPWRDHNAQPGVEDYEAYLDIFSNASGALDDGSVDNLECPDYSIITAKLGSGSARSDYIDEWFVDVDEMSDAQKTNFANWYTYYRNRDYVAKKAMSAVIAASKARVGLASLWNRNGVRTEIKNVDDLSLPLDTEAQKNKAALLKNVFNVSPNSGTPLRDALHDAGKYYQGTGYATSPILSEDEGGSCQQNFTILMTDGTWNGGSPGLSYADRNADSDKSSNFDGKAGDQSRYADSASNVNYTLADVAMHYYETDLAPLLPDNVPTFIGVDENDAQHMVTYTVAFGLTGTLDKDTGPDGDNFVGWPTPKSGEATTVDDVWHAAENGRGLFLSAAKPNDLIESLENAVSDLDSRSASASAVSVNTGSISSDTMVFQAEFNSQTWGGKLYGVEIELDGSIGTAHLASIVPEHSSRTIFTYNDDEDTGAEFQWDEISSAQQASLGGDEAILDYLRGDDTLSVAGGPQTHRARETLKNKDIRAQSPLGDIVNSSPVYVGNPQYYYPDNLEGASYNAFKNDPNNDSGNYREVTGERVLHRKPMIYVGANDGMLHAFNADSYSADFGMEEFAYVPASVYSRLERLGEKNYNHKYTVDGSPTVADVYDGDVGRWKTVLVSGLGAGGQGLFALDITNPETGFDSETNAAANVLWEFSDEDDADLGYTFAQPTIGKSHDSGKWAAFVGNGYNNTEADGNVGSGTAKLFVIDIMTGAKIAELDTGKNDLTTPNGLSTVNTLDVNGDYIVDYVYGGDLEGNLWRFDVSDADPSNWTVSKDVYDNPAPLFIACTVESISCPTDKRQSITVKPQIALNRGANGYVIFFGTGTYFLNDDNEDKGIQSMYGIWDRMQENIEPNLNRFHLLEQAILAEVKPTGSLNSYRATSSKNITWFKGSSGLPTDGSDADSLVDTHLGWFMDLVNTQGGNADGDGERIVSDPQLRDNNIIFTTSIPDQNPCSVGGSGWYMEIDALSGAKPLQVAIDVDDDDVVDDQDVITYSYIDENGDIVEVTEYVSGSSSENLLTRPVCITLDDSTEVCISNTSGTADANAVDECDAVGMSCQVRDPKSTLGRWTWQEL